MMGKKKPTPRVTMPDPDALSKFTPKRVRPHLAFEYRETRNDSTTDELVRNLTPWARRRALGLNEVR